MENKRELYTLRDLEVISEKMRDRGYKVSKWVSLAKYYVEKGCSVYVRDSKESESKYVTLHKGDLKIKIRFSAHKKGAGNDCDFYIGPNGMTAKNATIEINKRLLALCANGEKT